MADPQPIFDAQAAADLLIDKLVNEKAQNLVPEIGPEGNVVGFFDRRKGAPEGQPQTGRVLAYLEYLKQVRPDFQPQLGQKLPDFQVADPFESEGLFDSISNVFQAGFNESIEGLATQAITGEKIFDVEGFQPNWVEKIGIEVASFLSPVGIASLAFGAGIGGALVKGAATKTLVKILAKQGMKSALAKTTAKKILTTGAVSTIEKAAAATLKQQMARLAPRVAASVASTSASLGTFEAVRTPIAEVAAGKEFELAEFLGDALKGFAHGAGIGAAVGGAAGAIPGVIAGSALLSSTAKFGAEVGVFGSAAPFLEGRAPTFDDYLDAAAFIGVLKGVGAGVKRFTGVKAKQLKDEVDAGIESGKYTNESEGLDAILSENIASGVEAGVKPTPKQKPVETKKATPAQKIGVQRLAKDKTAKKGLSQEVFGEQKIAGVEIKPFTISRGPKKGSKTITVDNLRNVADLEKIQKFVAENKEFTNINFSEKFQKTELFKNLQEKGFVDPKSTKGRFRAVVPEGEPKKQPTKLEEASAKIREQLKSDEAESIQILTSLPTPKDPHGRGGLAKGTGRVEALRKIKEFVKNLKPKEKTRLRKEAEEAFLPAAAKGEAESFRVTVEARKWRKEFTELERENAGALIEGVENFLTGEKPKGTEKEIAAQKKASAALESERQKLNDYAKEMGEEEWISHLENYIPHFYTGNIKKAVARFATQTPSGKKRKHPTYKEAIAVGLKPITQDVAFLFETYGTMNWKIAANRRIVHNLKQLRTDQGKLAMTTGEQPAPDYVKFDHPAISRIYARKGKGGKLFLWRSGVWVHPDVVPVIRQALDNPLASRSRIGIIYDTTGFFAKTFELMFSGFHFGALFESGQAVLATAKNPFRGIFLVGAEARKFTGKSFAFTFKAGKELQAKRPDLMEAYIRDRLRFGSAKADLGFDVVSRNLRVFENKMRGIPAIGFMAKGLRKVHEGINKALWEQIHEGYKVFSHYDILAKEMLKMPEGATSKQIQAVRTKSASLINDAFGGQDWQSKFWLSPKGLHIARRMMLAPDWTLSNLQVFGRVIREYKDPTVRRFAVRYWRNMALTVFGTIQAFNMWSTGHPTWDNEIDHKLDIDITGFKRAIEGTKESVIPGYKSKLKKGQRYYIRIAKQAREILSWGENPIKIAGNKMNPIARQIFTQMSGADPGSGFPTDWSRKELDFYESLPSRMREIAETFTPFSLSDNNFAFSLPLSKGMTNHKAIRLYQRALEGGNWEVDGKPTTKSEALSAITEAADANGLDTKRLFSTAMGGARYKYYNEYYKALQDEDYDDMNEAALALKRLGATRQSISQSIVRRGLSKKEHRDALRKLREKFGNK